MEYPQAPDKKIQKLSNLLVRYAESEGVDFCFGQEQVYALEVFAHFGGLTLFLIEAKEQYEKIYNKIYTVEELMEPLLAKGKKMPELTIEQSLLEQEYLDNQKKTKIFPIEFYEQEDATYFGFIPRINTDLPADFALLAHFTHHALEEYIKQYKKNKMLLMEGKIPLDPLYDKLVKQINKGNVKIKIPTVKPNNDLSLSNQNSDNQN